MFVGVPNPNILMPLEKMTITVTEGKKKGEKITVLYNPEQYVQSRSVNMTKENAFGANGQESQIPSGDSETLSFTLFFDTMSAGAEVGGDEIERMYSPPTACCRRRQRWMCASIQRKSII